MLFMEFMKNLFKSKDKFKQKLKLIKSVLKFNGFSNQERLMIKGIVSISDLVARDLMVPRVDVIRVKLNANRKELIQLVKNTLHSRFPVFDNSVDDIKGVLHLRDIFNFLLIANKDFQIKKNLKEPIFIPESRPVLGVLSDLQKEYQQMAIVMDEYGGFSGIITMEDILEEIIGDVRDESDDKKETIILLDELTYSIDAREDLDSINERLNLNLIDEQADSIGGYVINLFGYIPKKGEKIAHQGVTYLVKSKKGNSVIRIIMEVSKEIISNADSKLVED